MANVHDFHRVKCQHPKFVAICSEPPQRTPLLWTYYDKALLNPYFSGGRGVGWLAMISSFKSFALDGFNYYSTFSSHTPPKFYTAPEKLWLEDFFPFWMVNFQGLS